MAAPDHLNDIERKLIDKLRTGTYSTDNRGATATAWTAGNVKVFGQWPSTEHAQYPCIIVEHVANGLEEQFFGRHLSGTSVGEIMGVGLTQKL